MKTLATLVAAAALTGCGQMGQMGQMGQGGMQGMSGAQGQPGGHAMQGKAGPDGMHGKEGMHGKGGMHAMMQQRMRSMDSNGDGLLSKEEFLKAHEAMYDSMPKNEQGLVDMKRMHGSMQR